MKLSRLTALIEQGLISGSNFLILLIAARALPAADWGVFSFALAFILLIQGLQRAAVILPMLNQCATPEGLKKNQSSWARMQIIATAISLALLMAIAAAAPFYSSSNAWIAKSAFIAMLLVCPIYYYEFSRRLLILQGRQNKLARVAALYFIVLAIGTAFLLRAESISVYHMVIIYFSAQLVGAAGTSWMIGIQRFTLTWTRSELVENLLFAKWAFLSSIAFSGYNFAIQAVLGMVSGPASVGIFNAIRNFIQPVNTLIQAMDSVDKPRASRQFAMLGKSGLIKAILSSMKWLLAIGGPFLVFVVYFGDNLLVIAYGTRYENEHQLIYFWAAAGFAILLAHPIETGLLVMRAPRQLFISRATAALVALLFALYLIPAFGVSGAVFALIVGWSIAALFGATLLFGNKIIKASH